MAKIIETYTIEKGTRAFLAWTGKEFAVKIPKVSKYIIETGNTPLEAKRKAKEYFERRKKFNKK